ncbi:hypothetical protein EMIT0158MI4_10304 [Burkholderia ambifaria]
MARRRDRRIGRRRRGRVRPRRLRTAAAGLTSGRRAPRDTRGRYASLLSEPAGSARE